MKQVVLLVGAGQIGLAIARRVGQGKTVVVADKDLEQSQKAVHTLEQASFDSRAISLDLASRSSILAALNQVQSFGDLTLFINAAGVSPSQVGIETILKVDLYGTAVLLEEVGKIIVSNGAGVTISSQSSHRLAALTEEEDRALATTDPESLLQLPFLQAEQIRDSLHAYQLAKRCNEKRVMYEAVRWGKRGARINSISPGIVMTPLALDELNGPRGDFYRQMFQDSPAGRPGTADEVAHVAELLLSDRAAFITGSDFLIDGGATTAYFYGKG